MKSKRSIFQEGLQRARALPGAFVEAKKNGLNLNKIKVIGASSVGTIMGLAIALNIPAERMRSVLMKLKTEQFQDWTWLHVIKNFISAWGVCKGYGMANALQEIIEDETGLQDPTFQELYDAGYTKELRVVTTNLSKGKPHVFSFKTTPDKKIASSVALSCSVPILFPPKWIVSKKGHRELHTDGGVILNYPWGIGSRKIVPPEKRLGFIFVNTSAAKAINRLGGNVITSLVTYLYTLITTIVFQHPLNPSHEVRRRTIPIPINLNPFDFNANESRQSQFDECGRKGVRAFVKKSIRRIRRDWARQLLAVKLVEKYSEKNSERILFLAQSFL